MLTPWKKSYDQPRYHIKIQKHYSADKGLYSQTMVFPVVMYGCESWTIWTFGAKYHPQEKEMQKSKMSVWGGLKNSFEKRSEKQRRKGKI